ncbi:hypothetical protein [Epibacterium ulvae]|uniref:hypothetical protein n=1 Tax=Epibacterium ulvae TaxID=1156985 RepID=UPI000C227777|nr:hypothetical protein [Epibacterium ulvae]
MIARLSKLVALLCSSGFSVGLILTSVVIVESWASMEPTAAIDWFAEFGLPLGFVMVPFGALALVFSAVALLSTLPSLRKTGVDWYWLAAFMLTACTMLLLPLYFWDANTLFFDGAILPADVPAEVQRWKFWNWMRTIMSVLASFVILLALLREARWSV